MSQVQATTPENDCFLSSFDFHKMLDEFKEASVEEKWRFPFPMGVLGTLRKGESNSPLMGSLANTSGSKDKPTLEEPTFGFERRWRPMNNCNYGSHHKAFLPHFYASGLSITCEKDSSAVFEIYTYDPENWMKMIRPVDGLEGFTPTTKKKAYGYYRTLAYLHCLPDGFEHDAYKGGLVWREGKRTLDIDPDEWAQYPMVTCWIYSSMGQNEACRQLGVKDCPIIWGGPHDS